jgi:hypothetical protein
MSARSRRSTESVDPNEARQSFRSVSPALSAASRDTTRTTDENTDRDADDTNDDAADDTAQPYKLEKGKSLRAGWLRTVTFDSHL